MENPFSTLGIEPRFDLDTVALQGQFLAALGATHPDRFTDPIEQAEAAERAAMINQANRTLRDPLARAEALLRLYPAAGGDEKALPPGFLMEVMEVREEMEEAVAARDQPTIERLRQWARDQQEMCLGRVAEAFVQLPAPGAGGDTGQAIQAIRMELNALRYYQRMIEQTGG